MKDENIVARYTFLESLRSWRLITIILIYAGFIMVTLNMGSLTGFILRLILNKDNLIPYTLVLPYYACVIIIPIISILLTYDSISGLRTKKNIRIVFTRIKRDALLFGKLMTSTYIIAFLILSTFIPIVFYTFSKLNRWIWLEACFAMLYLILLGFAFISITVFISSITRRSGSSLRLAFIVLALLILASAFGCDFSPFAFMSSGLRAGLIGSDQLLKGIAMLLAYPFILSFASHISLRKSDE